MTMIKTKSLIVACAVVAVSLGTVVVPASAQMMMKKPMMHHKMMHGKMMHGKMMNKTMMMHKKMMKPM